MTVEDLEKKLSEYPLYSEVELTDPPSLIVKDTDGKWHELISFWESRKVIK